MKNFWQKHRRKVLGTFALLLFMAGGYLLLLVRAPAIPLPDSEEIQIIRETPVKDDRIIIPDVGINAPIVQGDYTALDKGVWHRFPERGNADKGGNFILSAHRWTLAPTPARTREKSYFYHLDKSKIGQEIIIHWKGKRYNYVIAETKQIKPNQTEIEKRTKEHRLTVYTCTLGGVADGRVVLIAKPVDTEH